MDFRSLINKISNEHHLLSEGVLDDFEKRYLIDHIQNLKVLFDEIQQQMTVKLPRKQEMKICPFILNLIN